MSEHSTTVIEFQRRRAATWSLIRWWLLLAALCVVALFVLPFTSVSSNMGQHLRIGLPLIVGFVVCLGVINRLFVSYTEDFARYDPRNYVWNPSKRCDLRQ
jgi:lipopolysaccharide export LptBFGC system permease protein LptF